VQTHAHEQAHSLARTNTMVLRLTQTLQRIHDAFFVMDAHHYKAAAGAGGGGGAAAAGVQQKQQNFTAAIRAQLHRKVSSSIHTNTHTSNAPTPPSQRTNAARNDAPLRLMKQRQPAVAESHVIVNELESLKERIKHPHTHLTSSSLFTLARSSLCDV